MNKKKILFWSSLFIVIVSLFVWNFTQGNQQNRQQVVVVTPQPVETQTTKALDGENDVLVVYFSRTKGIYNGPLEVGNTKRLADFIKEATNGDEYEIIPVQDYPDDYQTTTEVARREQRENARPAIANALPDLSGYETIFIGAPVWWSEYPMIVRTFLDAQSEALAGKTIVPFTTHEGSGLGNTERLLRTQFTNSTVLEGFTVRGNSAKDAQNDVNQWLKRIGVVK